MKKNKYRSKFEESVAKDLESRKVNFEYESLKIKYTIPESKHTYTPDKLLDNGVVVEIKGRFLPKDRQKHLLIKQQHPEYDIRFCFMKDLPINKGSKTFYSDWCKKNGFLYCFKTIPEEWLF